MSNIDSELSPEEEAAAHTQLVQLFEKLVPKEGKPFQQREMIVSEDRTKAIDLNRGMGGERLVKLDGEPEHRISEAGELIDPETGKPAPAKAAEYVRFITAGKPFAETMAPALDNVDLATNPERQDEARDKLVAQIKEILPSDSGESMAVIDSRAGKVLVGRDTQGGVSLTAESGEVLKTQDGKLMEQNPRSSLVPVEVSPGKAVELTERLKHGAPVELPKDSEERLALLRSMELPISFSQNDRETPKTNADYEANPERVAAANAELEERLKAFEEFFDKNSDRRWVEINSDKGELYVGKYDSGLVVLTQELSESAHWEGKVYWQNESGELEHYAPAPAPEKAAEFIDEFKTGRAETDEGETVDVGQDVSVTGASIAELVEPYKKFLEENPSERIWVGMNLALERGSDEFNNGDRIYLIHAGSEDPADYYWLDESGELVGLKEQPAPAETVKFAEILKDGTSELDPLPPEEAEAAYREVSELFDEKKPAGEEGRVVIQLEFPRDRGELELLRDESTGARIIVDKRERAKGEPGTYVLKDGELMSRDEFQKEEPVSRKAAELSQDLREGRRKVY